MLRSFSFFSSRLKFNSIFLCSVVYLASLLASPLACADNHSNEPSFQSETLQRIAYSKQWKHLLHYHQVGLFPSDESQADDPNFFLAAAGKTDPYAELAATINAFASSNPDHARNRCLYPARFAWLSQQIPGKVNGESSCPKFEKWRDEIDARDLSLIFPAAYLNSPSSMFGHTLMRIDTNKHNNPLLAYSINYAANADPNDNELVFSYKGLTGGYPGVFSVLPYYQKVKEYNYLESRDVWEYDIDISESELEQFLRHIWEIKDTHFDYYFFTENCSYHLLTLLDAASERFDLAKHFNTDVIPADTVRVLKQEGFLESAVFRPSMQTTMKHQLASTSKPQHSFAVSLLEEDIQPKQLIAESNMGKKETAQGLDLSVALARYRAKKDKETTKFYNRRSIELLSERSKIDVGQSFSETPVPKTRDDEGHLSHRGMVRAGHNQRGNYAGFDLRMAYHDFLDPSPGYITGAQLEILHFKFNAYLSDESVEIEEFRAIDIASFSPRNDFIKPISWFVSTGLERNIGQRDELMPYLKAGPGLTYGSEQLIDGVNVQSSLVLSTRLNLDSDISKGYAFASGPKLLFLAQGETINLQAEWSRHYKIAGNDFDHQDAFFGLGLNTNSKYGVRAGIRYQEAKDQNEANTYDTSGELGLSVYF
jgi:Domain of unknown function (DUF4105)